MRFDPMRAAARVLMGSTYTVLGADALREPGARPEAAAPTLAAVRTVVPLPEDDKLLVQVNAGVQVAAGVLLALGRLPRLSALALVASMVPTTIAGHAFWAVDDPAARKPQQVQFHKNMAMIGGLLFVASEKRGAQTAPAD